MNPKPYNADLFRYRRYLTQLQLTKERELKEVHRKLDAIETEIKRRKEDPDHA